LHGDRVLRTVTPYAADDFEYVRSTGLIEHLVDKRLLVAEEQVDHESLGEIAAGASYILEHPRLPFISYPYEWSFSALQAAALLQLDVHIKALEYGVTLSDASAYNIQFQGPAPIFIDHLSFRRYREGEFWDGHGQFCQQFLAPLLLRAVCGVAHNPWFRGSLEGISVSDLNRILPLRAKFSPKMFTHIVLQDYLQTRGTGKKPVTDVASQAKQRKLPKTAFNRMLSSMRNWIAKLRPADDAETVWRNYAQGHSYTGDEVAKKKSFINQFTAQVAPTMLWDLGCNTGDYSKVALAAGAALVVGFDFDQGALELAYARAREEKLNFLPLFLDATNPAPDQGWAQSERRGLAARTEADAIVALALVHHLAIARNIPLEQVIAWLMEMAPSGVIEFVPKSDAMVQQLLQLREDIFPDYCQENFLNIVRRRGKILQQEKVSKSGRLLVWYHRG
jgi:ribosomal protein L11 methylase PrmA